MKKQHLLLIILVAFIFLVSGCANSAEETTSENTEGSIERTDSIIEPEQLISKEEAAILIGEAVMDEQKTDQEVVGQKLAFYESADENSFKFIQISLSQQAYMPDTGITPKELYYTTISAFEGEEVDGIGDEAIIATPGLHILADGYYIVIGAGNSDNEEVQAILKEAGEIAVQNLYSILNK